MLKYIISIFIIIITLYIHAITLEEAIKYAEDNNAQIIISKSNENMSKLNRYKSIGNFLPKISGSLNYVKLDSVPTFLMSTPVGVQRIEMGVEDNYSLEINFSMPIFMGGKIINGYLITKDKSKIAELETEQNISNIKMSVIQIYSSALLLNEMINVVEELYKSTMEHYDVAKSKYENGTASKLELLIAETKLKSIEPQLYKMKNDYNSIINTLKLLIGYDMKKDIQLEGNIELLAKQYNVEKFDTIDIDIIEKDIDKRRHELNIMDKKIDILKRFYNINKMSILPNIVAFSKYKYYNVPRNGEELYVLNDTLLMDHSLIFGISVGFDIFTGGKKIIDIMSTREQLKQLNYVYNVQRESIINEIEKIYNDYLLSLKNIESYKAALNTAKESYKMAKSQYEEGIISNSDYIDVEVNYIQAQANYSQGIYNQIIQYFTLLNAIGEL